MSVTVIRGARVVDGLGTPWFYADVVLNGDRIGSILPPGSYPDHETDQRVEAKGMVVCPGFIDIQSHSIIPLMMDPRCLSKITQGVTTEIMGESWTPAPVGGKEEHEIFPLEISEEMQAWRKLQRGWTRFRHWPEAMIARGVSPNIGSYLGGGTLRSFVRGLGEGPSTPDQLDEMRRVVREAMEDGAFGVAYALIYPPDTFAGTDEIVEVCKIVNEYGGTYITHMRSEADQILDALEEALEIGRRAQVPVEIYHLKAIGPRNWPKMEKVIARINAARAAGQDVTADMYPYVAGGTGLSSVFPPHLSADGKFFERVGDPALRAEIKAEVLHPSGGWEALGTLNGPENVYPLDLKGEESKQYVGKSLAQIAEMRGQHWVDAAADLLVSEQQRIGTVYFMMSEENLARQLREPWIKISTDAGGLDPVWAAEGPTHPRSYGTYPRVLGKYVREEGIITLEEAVRKMTSAVARRLGIMDRGLLQPGCCADVVIFDPETIGDRATFEDSHQLSVGVRDVWVNGTRVLADGTHTGATPGRYVPGPGTRIVGTTDKA